MNELKDQLNRPIQCHYIYWDKNNEPHRCQKSSTIITVDELGNTHFSCGDKKHIEYLSHAKFLIL